jgi:hypothetical protein
MQCRITRAPSRQPLLTSQKSRNRKLFSASPYEEDFRRLKLTSFDKLQVPFEILYFSFSAVYQLRMQTWDPSKSSLGRGNHMG